MRDQGLQTILMGGDGIASEEYAQIAGPGAEGTLMTFPPDPRLNPAAAEVVKRFEAKKFNPETYTLYSYAAVQVMRAAIDGTLKPGDTSVKAGKLGELKIVNGSVVLLGDPVTFTKANINNFDF